jgi:hypothetical protein
LIFTFFIFVDY